MERFPIPFGFILFLALVGFPATGVEGSSHMDAPLITFDDAANTTDVYAFRSQSGGTQYLTTAVAVYPFEDPGIGPNAYQFDDNVRYEIHVSLGSDLQEGKKTLSYQFRFKTQVQNPNTILPLTGPVENVGDSNQNLRQTYTVTKVDHRTRTETNLSEGQTLMVPPNNQGNLTPEYQAAGPNSNRGDNPAQSGATTVDELDKYTKQAINTLLDGYLSFAGQREDGFYADIQSVFDLDFVFGGPNKPADSQQGFNVHTFVLNIPLSELEGFPEAGVHATTSRPQRTSLSRRPEAQNDRLGGPFVQVGRQGNPLFNEGFVAMGDKDLYSRTDPTRDVALFAKYAEDPELARLIGLSIGNDVRGIFIPDVIKVYLNTGPAHLAGDPEFNRLSIFGGDVLSSPTGGNVPGGWPNGRRFGDDVLDIGVLAVVDGLISVPTPINIDKVPANDIPYNKVFPYAATPLNGRSHKHDCLLCSTP